MSSKLPAHIEGLLTYLSSPEEKANEDLIIQYFRKVFGESFTRQKGAPNAVGKAFAAKYKSKKTTFLKKAAYQFPSVYLDELLQGGSSVIKKEIDSFEKTLKQKKRIRHKITTKNFATVLKQMVDYFETGKPIKVVRAFYSMIFGWDQTSVLDISAKRPTQATLGGEVIDHLKPGKREIFKKFVESHYIHLEENENVDDFFAMYDKALDAVDPEFRIMLNFPVTKSII